MHRKVTSILLCGILAAGLTVSGCSTTGSTSSSDGTENVISISSTTVSGLVDSIDDKEVTLTIGSLVDGSIGGGGSMGGGDMPSGEAPSGDDASSDSASTDSDSSEVPEKPADDSSAASTDDAAASTDDAAASTDDTAASTDDAVASTDDAAASTDDAAASTDDSSSQTFVSGETSAVLTINDESMITGFDGTEMSLEDIAEGDVLTVTIDEDGAITAITIEDATVYSSDSSSDAGGSDSAMGGGSGQSTGVDSYDAVTEIAEDTTSSGETYESTGTDENAIHVLSGAVAKLTGITLNRTSDDSTGGDNSSFYGVGSGLLVSDGTAYISDSTITTDAAGGAGVFAYDSGVAYVADTTITTTQDTSGGIHAAGGGTLYAWDLDVTTSGESSAAIRSDRGGGTMVVNGGTYTSNGVGSPAIYCTADIAVNGASLTANGSEAVCIEGLNTLRLYDCDLVGNMPDDEQNDCTWTIIVYQSMSGDSEVGNGTFEMVGGSLTAENGGLLYTTNTECTMVLSDVDITYADDSEYFLMCTGNTNERGWGTEGSNGSQCNFTADSQEMQGDVIYDSISTLDFYMSNGSSLTGAFVDDETYAGDGGDGYCNVYISSDSTWTVTGDSTVTALYNEGTIVDESGAAVSVVGTDGTVYVTGDSEYTITVSSYDTTADFSSASSVSSWSDYEVEEPSELTE